MSSERDELISGIQAALSGPPTVPLAPQVPGVPSDATQSIRDAAHAAILSKPAEHQTIDEASYVAAVKDHGIHVTLSKPADQVTKAEHAELLAAVRDWAANERA